MLPIVTPEQMARIDAAAPEPIEVLIERAGRRVARSARQILGGVYGRRVVAIAGPGNNGADTRVAARVLERQGVAVQVVGPTDRLPSADLVIDGAFGTGMNREHRAPELDPTTPVLAVDIPSGIDGLTGRGTALTATRTVTFAALKPGLLLGDGPAYCGDIEIADIGLDVSGARAWLFTRHDAIARVPHRRPDDHKWRRAVVVVGGSPGMSGAPRLAAEGAFRAAAGYVHCLLPGGRVPQDRSEVVFTATEATGWGPAVLDAAARAHALVIGPGFAPTAASDDLVDTIERLPPALPVVIDGAALRLIGGLGLRPNIVLTPHDGEFEALPGTTAGDDRFAAARLAAATTGATVLLKGPVTVVASPDGRCVASARGDSRLATAGTGDVLAGVVGAFLAAGLPPMQAGAFGAWLHGDAARRGPRVGFVASDLLPELAHSLSALAASGGVHATD